MAGILKKPFVLFPVFIAVLIAGMFAAVKLPALEVVRSSIQSGIDADAYFYSEVEGFREYEKAVAEKRREKSGT